MQVQLETVTLTHDEYASLLRQIEDLQKSRADLEKKNVYLMADYVHSLKEQKRIAESALETVVKYVALQTEHEMLQKNYIETLKCYRQVYELHYGGLGEFNV